MIEAIEAARKDGQLARRRRRPARCAAARRAGASRSSTGSRPTWPRRCCQPAGEQGLRDRLRLRRHRPHRPRAQRRVLHGRRPRPDAHEPQRRRAGRHHATARRSTSASRFKPTATIMREQKTVDGRRRGDDDQGPRAATTRACCRAPCRWSRRWPRWCWPTTRCGRKPSARRSFQPYVGGSVHARPARSPGARCAAAEPLDAPLTQQRPIAVVATEHHHAIGRPLEEFLGHRDAVVAVPFRKNFLPGNVALVDEGEAGARRRRHGLAVAVATGRRQGALDRWSR